ncbi:MAG: T9SS type A sorting domain-containing protein, partial [Candidatus Marinimicrobia bacterium]|nr:T9SS type A sorting domain-containing protein [Candidatus Neomarinimicrobiota bacterium]
DYISASPDVPSGTEPFTVEAWVKTTQTQGRTIVGWGKNSYSSNTHCFGISATHISGLWNNWSFGYDIAYYGNMNISGKWTHIAYSFNGTEPLKLYVNGVHIGTLSSMGTSYEGNTNFNIGAKYYSSMESFFDGQMDELRIWDVGRTQAEIVANMCKKVIPTNESHLLVYYDFDQTPNAAILYDRKFDGDGTLTNMDAANAWVKSGALLGDASLVLASTTPTLVGITGQSCLATITSTPSTSNFLNLYNASTGFGPVSVADVGVWPVGIIKRADVIWGVHAVGTVTANLVFDYSQIAGISNPDLIRLIKRSDAGSEWSDVTSDFVHNTTAKTFTKLNNSSFSEYSVGTQEGDNSLPVELSSFNAHYESGNVVLKWTTESEVENLGFIMERRLNPNAPSWDRIATFQTNTSLKGQGTKSGRSTYKYADSDVKMDQTYYYRLLDVDYSGVCRVNDTLSINPGKYIQSLIPKQFALLPAYPNPFNPRTTIVYQLPKAEFVNVTVYDISGRQIASLVNEQKAAGTYRIAWEPHTLASGIYLIRIQAGHFVSIQKCMMMK